MMNNKGTKAQSFGLEIPDWKLVRIPDEVELLAKTVVDAAFAVHKELGPGLLESAYEACLSHELRLRGVEHQLQLPVPLNYKGILVEIGYRADVVVEEKLLVELKAIDQLSCRFIPRKSSLICDLKNFRLACSSISMKFLSSTESIVLSMPRSPDKALT